MLGELQQKILTLKKEKQAAILAHSYQAPEIQEIADFCGDSFALSVKAQSLREQTVVVCGVRFMADTVKLLNPDKRVILPVEQATCPMADQITPERILAFRREHPEFLVVAYINTSTRIKAVCDVCVTSSSAEKIIAGLPDRPILFIPDQNLGGWIREKYPEREIVLWDGKCPVHAAVTAEDCLRAKALYPKAKLAVHPECRAEVLQYADYIGSTAGILAYARGCEEDVIIGTEKTIAQLLAAEIPERRFPVLSKTLICPDMRLCDLSDVRRALEGTGGEEIEIEPKIAQAAKHAIDEMIRLG